MAEITDFGVTAAGILQPHLKSRYMIAELEGVDEKTMEGLRLQTVSFSYKEDRFTTKSICEWILEDDVSGNAAKAMDNLNRHEFLKVALLNGNGKVLRYIIVKEMKLLTVDYELDYALSDACKFIMKWSAKNVYNEYPLPEEFKDFSN